jgi:hypothetical protein
VRLALFLRELEHADHAFDVHQVRGGGRELAARREQRGQVENEVHLELGQDALEQVVVEDRARVLLLDQGRLRRIERLQVEGDDRAAAVPGEPLDQAVADLAAGAGNEHDGLSDHVVSPAPSCLLLPF